MNFPDKGNPLNLSHDFIIGKFDSIKAAGGVRPASKEFLLFLRKAADEFGAILIFDECVTSRLNFNGMQGALDIIPDMTVVGKVYGRWITIRNLRGREDIINPYDPDSQGIEKVTSTPELSMGIYSHFLRRSQLQNLLLLEHFFG
ncbi:hypothetical protein TWF506_001183 [Arthrobotrys conoides]|uniref:Uncharacterized protein n=1 Tax=Arthrobotrys conoides TaxID=74498 RepID=A0AAN8P1M2_9PEZI